MTIGSQLPSGNALTLDHIAHFVGDMSAGGGEYRRLGFTLTPFSPQFNALGPNGIEVPAGTANRCALFRAGYVELLSPHGPSTPLADQMRRQIERYTGLHLIAFATADAEAQHARLDREGFAPTPIVRLRRAVDTPAGPDEVRFTVARVPPEVMPEGRVQILTHHTEAAMWQPRFLEHPNSAEELAWIAIAVEDPEETARRFARFTDCVAQAVAPDLWEILCARGRVRIGSAAAIAALLPGAYMAPLPFMAGYGIRVAKLARALTWFDEHEIDYDRVDDEIIVHAAPGLGGTLVFSE